MALAARYREQEIDLHAARLRVQELHWREPIDNVIALDDGHSYFDMCLTPRPAEACGSYLEQFGGSEYEPLGRMIFVPAGVPLRVRAGLGSQWALQCWFSDPAFDELASGWSRERLRETLHVRNPGLKAVCDRIVAEMSEPGFASAVVVESLCSVIAVDLVRHFSTLRPLTNGGLPGWRLRRIEERIRSEGPAPTLAELAALCGLSPRHLTRAFREQTGRTLSDVVGEARLSRATALLASDDLSLAEISERLGFAHPSAFSAAFRRATGEQPSAYRARVRAGGRPAFLSRSHKLVS